MNLSASSAIEIEFEDGSSVRLQIAGKGVRAVRQDGRALEPARPVGRYMDIDTCAVYIGRTANAVRMLVKRGQIPRLKVGDKVQFDRERIDRWMERHTRRGASLSP